MVVVALALLALTLWSTYSVIANAASEFLITTLAALVLPSILLATILAGGAAGILAVGLLPWRPLLSGAAGGLAVGLLAMAGTLVAYHHGPAVPYVAAVVAVDRGARRRGGRVPSPGRRQRAGIAGGVAATALGLVVAYFQNDLVDLFGNQETVGTMAEAASRLQLDHVRRQRRPGRCRGLRLPAPHGLALPWPCTPPPARAAGVLTLVATLLGWLGRLPLTEIVEDYSEFDAQIIYSRLPEQINHGMIVLFAGAFAAMILVGRTMRRPARK